jgi:hypothetical protein
VTNNNEIKLTTIKRRKVWFVKKETQLIVYSRDENRLGVELEEMLEDLVSKESVEICRTISDLILRLRMPLCESAIAVLLVSDEEDLRNILAIQPFLTDMRIVLILPDRNDITIEAGHSLHPRYLSFTDNGLRDMKAVLARMIEGGKTTYGQFNEQGLSS